ncbi:antitoxin Xre/MbcA/ParS toxin-binding domain-containing protein [Mesorhizobium sp. ISC25]|uniref:antitoxin Xre/MbcA/ParS-like domain-containing protein n=1 Tax=Mesorhizobium sp. ISC25 TaxID=3077335 RepID=UPI0035D9EEBA
MTGTWNRIDPIRQTEFANAVAVEIERVLARQGKVTNSDAVVAAGRVAGAVAAAVALLAPTDIRAIDTMQERLPGMASRFVRILAAEAAERSARTRLSGAHGGQETDVQPAGSGDLDAMRVEDWAGRVAGSTFLQENLGISRSTLHRWQRSGTVVALRTGGRKHVFPLAQFIDGRPAPGIKEVSSAMPDPRRAWSWLIGPAPGLAGRIPIEMLKQDLVAEVVLAAQNAAMAKLA